ncbi:MAG: ATP-binding protein [Desulfobacterales bacterium]
MSQVCERIRNKTYALNLLIAKFSGQPDPSLIFQIRNIRSSLENLFESIATLGVFDAREKSLFHHIRKNSRELEYFLEKLITGSIESENAMETKRFQLLTSQLWIKTQFISDDTRRLIEASQYQIAVEHKKAAILTIALIISLVLINAAISYFSGRSIARSEKELRQLNETLEHQVAERTALAEARAKQLQSLAVELIEAEDVERQRIAELLHEDLQQILVSARFQLEAASQSNSFRAMIPAVDALLEESIKKSRRLSHELSPPILQYSGLVDILRWLSRKMDERFGLKVIMEVKSEKKVYHALKIFLFRAVQELLFNVVKHSGTNTARLILSGSDTHIVINVSDQGKGFKPEIPNSFKKAAGFGLISIQERASHIGGSLEIESIPGQGSSFTLTVPVRSLN